MGPDHPRRRPVLGAVFVAEIGDVTRFDRPEKLCSWAGMTPRHRESDTTVHRGRITKQGNHLVRWAAIEAVRDPRSGRVGAGRRRLPPLTITFTDLLCVN